MKKQRHSSRWLQYEMRGEKLAPPEVFRTRLVRSGGLCGIIIGVSLAIGVLGYHFIGGLESWVDCIYNASMILGGMGPVDKLTTDVGKLFASGYALFSGVTLLTSVGVLLAPVLHRLLHHFHVDSEQ